MQLDSNYTQNEDFVFCPYVAFGAGSSDGLSAGAVAGLVVEILSMLFIENILLWKLFPLH